MRWRDELKQIEDSLDDQGRGSWEPKAYFFFRRLFRYSLGAFLLLLFAFFSFRRLRYHLFGYTEKYYLVAGIALGLALLGAVVGGIGIFFTVPLDKKRRRKRRDSSKRRRWRR